MYMRMGKDGRVIKDFIFITGVGRHRYSSLSNHVYPPRKAHMSTKHI